VTKSVPTLAAFGCLGFFIVWEDVMRSPHVDDFVRLTRDLPELELSRGEVGVVRSTWCAPNLAYEVEFTPSGLTHQTRALLMAEQVEVAEASVRDAQLAGL
jgi:hypothetical protein